MRPLLFQFSIAALTLVAGQGTTQGVPTPAFNFCPGLTKPVDYVPYMATAGRCVHAQAVDLEVSGERPDEVATAAVSACSGEITTAATMVDACLGNHTDKSSEPAYRVTLHNQAVETVVRIRAVRHGRAKVP